MLSSSYVVILFSFVIISYFCFWCKPFVVYLSHLGLSRVLPSLFKRSSKMSVLYLDQVPHSPRLFHLLTFLLTNVIFCWNRLILSWYRFILPIFNSFSLFHLSSQSLSFEFVSSFQFTSVFLFSTLLF